MKELGWPLFVCLARRLARSKWHLRFITRRMYV